MDGETHRVQRNCMSIDKDLRAVVAVTRLSTGDKTDGAELRGNVGGSGYRGGDGYGYGGLGGWDGKDVKPSKTSSHTHRCFRCGVLGHRVASCTKPPAE